MKWQDDIPGQNEVGGGGRWYYWVSFCPAQENLSTLQGNGSCTIIWLEHHGRSKGENVHSDGSKPPRGISHLSFVLSSLVEWCRNQSMWLSGSQAKSAYCQVRFPCLRRGYLSSHGTSLSCLSGRYHYGSSASVPFWTSCHSIWRETPNEEEHTKFNGHWWNCWANFGYHCKIS